jgi:competence protein ComEC
MVKLNRELVLALLTGLVWLAFFTFPEAKLRLVFCDVGQGDAILVSQGFNQVLIDGGPGDSVLSCLGRNLPFYDRQLEAVILTHPDNDHAAGLNAVLDQYEVECFVSGPEGSQSGSWQALLRRVREKEKEGLRVINLYQGESLKLGLIRLESLWPDREWVLARVSGEELAAGNQKGSVLGAKTEHKNLNDFSLVLTLRYQNKSVLLMGDADSRVQDEIMDRNTLSQIDILKFPHHGSKTGIREEFLEKIRPQVAVISVGKNSFGHPAPEVLSLLEKYGIEIRRTDKEGEIGYEF